ncbi:unnamed protein product, partial [Ixodes pacificus]
VTIASSEKAGVSRSRGMTLTCSENDCLTGPGCGRTGNSAPGSLEGPPGLSRTPCSSGTVGESRERRGRERRGTQRPSVGISAGTAVGRARRSRLDAWSAASRKETKKECHAESWGGNGIDERLPRNCDDSSPASPDFTREPRS